jgi:hypothetical protein
MVRPAGRASKATADMVGILILKEMEDLTDEEPVGRVAFDIRWQYALDLAPGAADAWLLLDTFKTSKNIRDLDGYRLLHRLFSEQCAVEPGEQITLRRDVSGESLQSPFDPGAGYSGHKGKGYQAQITETCEPENAVQIITHAAVESAAQCDAESPVRDTEELEARGLKPDTLLADTAYCGGDNDVALRGDMGVALIGPAAGKDPGANTAVECAVFMKIAACNIKRYMRARIEQARQCARAAQQACVAGFVRQNAPARVAGRLTALVLRGLALCSASAA